MIRQPRKIFVYSVALALGSALIASGLWTVFPGVFASWEGHTFDLRLQFQQSLPASSDLAIIGRDAKSDRDPRLGSGVWDRKIFANVIQALTASGAKIIASDFYFSTPGKSDRGGAGSDQALIEATQQAGMGVYPLPPVRLAPMTADHLDFSNNPYLRGSKGNLPVLERTDVPPDAPENARTPPFSERLLREAAGIGHISAEADQDGVYRRVSAFLERKGQTIPAFSVAVLANFFQVAPKDISLILGQDLTFQNAKYPSGDVETIHIPVNHQGQFLVNYAGKWEDPPFAYFSFVDVLDAMEDGRQAELKERFEGKIVFLLHAGAIADKRKTPLEFNAPGGFIHVNAVNTMLMGTMLTETSSSFHWLITIFSSVISAALVLAFSPVVGIGLVIGWMGIYCSLVLFVFTLGGWVLPVLPPLLGALLAGVGALTWSASIKSATLESLEQRILEDQRELNQARESAVQQEILVERLEEDLEASRQGAASSAESNQELLRNTQELESQFQNAQSELQQSREEINRLQAHLASIRKAEIPSHSFSKPELAKLSQECAQLGILTRDPVVLGQFKDLKKAAQSPMPILLLGEAGTGKELFAKAVHILSPRVQAPFIPLNMAAIPSELFESQIFGHRKGAFSGAHKDHKGVFEQADTGTVFLDEIGDLRLDMQAKMLRVLQEGAFYRVGATSPTTVDVRVVAATNRDLAQGVVAGWFREDLYFRLRGLFVVLPPLRERNDDIPLLADQFMKVAAEALKKVDVHLSTNALQALMSWRWPGNIRELKHCLEQAVTLVEGDLITEKDLRLEPSQPLGPVDQLSNVSLTPDLSGDAALLATLRENGFDMQATAEIVDWDRSTVTQRLKGLCFQALLEHDYDRTAAAQALAGIPSLTKIVEMKLNGYYDHLLKIIGEAQTLEEAMTIGRKRLKNLPDRHMLAMESLIRHQFESHG